MPEIILQKATENDIDLIQRLAVATWEPTYGKILSKEQVDFMQQEIYAEEALKKQMQEGQEFYVIMFNAELIGFLSFSVSDQANAVYKLNKIYLQPEVQGKGFGKQALDAAEKLVKEKGAKVLILNVNRHNTALKFYESCGYTITREEDIPIGKYWMNDYVMEKTLL